MRRTVVAMTITVLSGVPGAAWAQSTAWGNSGYISVNGMYETTTSPYQITTTQEINQESAPIVSSQEAGHGLVGDVMTGGRMHGNLGIGFGLTFGRSTQDAAVTGDIPHPFYFDQPRALTGSTELRRDDLAVHVDLMWLLPLSDRFQMALFGGPSWFQIKQQVIKSVAVEETYPFDSVSLGNVALDEIKGSQVGYNAGLDASFFFSRYVGVQGLLRYSKATVTLGSSGQDTSIDAGGLQVGGGLRVRF